MAQERGNDLKPLLEKLLQAFDDEDDRDLLHRTELDHMFRILRANKEKITSQPPDVEKKEELPELLRKIDEALQQCKARSKQQQTDNAKSKKMTLPSVSDCNPFKSRSPEFSVEPLLQHTITILGDAPSTSAPAANHDAAGEDTVLYEWTTSYVDESRIYGWADEADKVVDALVGLQEEEGKEDQLLFRAAGIAGIHGSGKTALAQKVFVHDRIKDAFPLRLWVCVGPPDHEDRFNLLYRMLDNLGLDTAKVEDIVDKADVVVKADSADKDRSKIGVLLFILYVTLYKTGYLIVFDDIRAYGGGDGWYSNLTLEPPKNGEWYERLAYGLPKARKSAVLVTCRSEDHARTMVRTGRVFRPPRLGVDDGWKLFQREYEEAKKKGKEESVEKVKDEKEKEKQEDKLYHELEQMKEEIVNKCLGLPVAIVEAAKGFALLEHKPDDPPKADEVKVAVPADETVPSKTEPGTQATEANQPAN
uniref:Uncharacterized protein n=1 Tax=Avena sativa TaxID=4498 RepID=A0ACD5U9T4_AVESA